MLVNKRGAGWLDVDILLPAPLEVQLWSQGSPVFNCT
jgi:hypothetical protein